MTTCARIRAGLLIMLTVAFLTSTSAARTRAKVMTYNVDEGTDFDALVAVLSNPSATPEDFQNAVNQTINEVVASNPVLRAQLIAQEIASGQPDLVGLQEAAVWTFFDEVIDLRQLILDDLAALNQHYIPVVTAPEFQITIAGLNVSFMDQDVILVRTDEAALQVTGMNTGHYTASVPLPGFSPYLPPTNLTRGWASVDVLLNGTHFRFITTHLEDGTNPIPVFALVQALQEIQLVYSPALTALPVIIGGDFNTVANNPSSPTFLTYKFMLANGFVDAWSRANPNLVGATCCQADLLSSVSQLTQRIDQVFLRNHVGVVGAQLLGDEKVDNGSWPSDHAAVNVLALVGK